jgi:hypothetical protein
MGMPLSVPAKNVMAISGDCFRQGAFPSIAEKANQSTPLTGREQNRDLGVVFAEFDRVWPVAGLTLALMATVSSIGGFSLSCRPANSIVLALFASSRSS